MFQILVPKSAWGTELLVFWICKGYTTICIWECLGNIIVVFAGDWGTSFLVSDDGGGNFIQKLYTFWMWMGYKTSCTWGWRGYSCSEQEKVYPLYPQVQVVMLPRHLYLQTIMFPRHSQIQIIMHPCQLQITSSSVPQALLGTRTWNTKWTISLQKMKFWKI